MTKPVKLFGVLGIIIVSAILGMAVFVCLSYKYMWYPVPVNIIRDDFTGVMMKVVVGGEDHLSDWWEKSKGITIKIQDSKNDGHVFRIVIYKDFSPWQSVAFLKGGSGEKFAVVNFLNDFYILHRIPQALGQEFLEHWVLPGNGLIVAPDESGIFIYSGDVDHPAMSVVKYGWNKEVLAKVTFPYVSGELVETTFFAKGTKLAFKQVGMGDQSSVLYVWDLEKNILAQFSANDKTLIGRSASGRLYLENDHLYLLDYNNKKVLVQ